MNNNPPDFEQMRAELMTRVDLLARRRRTKVRVSIAGGIVLASALATGAAWVVQAPRTEIANAVYCYEEASTTARYGQAVMADSTPTAPGASVEKREPDRVREAIEQCKAVWGAGVLDPDATADGPNGMTSTPGLFACQRNDGVLAVFPATTDGPTTCEDLGLRPPE